MNFSWVALPFVPITRCGRWICILLASFLAPFALSGQTQVIHSQLVFENITTDEGLPSNEIYHAIQDSVGYIWFATNNGVSRYNGYHFENFGIEEGLEDNTIFELYPDYRGRIWFISHVGNLAYFENGTIKAFPFNDKIQKALTANRGPVKKSFYVDRSDNVHISFKRYGRLKISPDGFVQKIGEQHNRSNLHIERLIDGTMLLLNPMELDQQIVTFSDGINNFKWQNKDLFGGDYLSLHISAEYHNNSIFLTCKGVLNQIWDNKILSQAKFGNDIIWLSIDANNNLWVSPAEGGAFCYDKANLNAGPSHSVLDNSQVTSVLCDKEQGYWFTTLNDGVFYCRSIKAQTYLKDESLSGNRISALHANDAIHLGFDNGLVGILTNDTITYLHPAKPYLSFSTIRNITEAIGGSGLIVSSSIMIHHILPKERNRTQYSIRDFKGVLPRQIIRSIKGDYIIASVQGITRFDGQLVTYDSHKVGRFSSHVYSIYEKSDGTILLGCADGLWEFNNGSFKYLGLNNPLLSKQILSISGFHNGVIFLGTKGIGLIALYPDGTTRQFSTHDGIASNTVKHVFIDGNYVWLSTSNGANRLFFYDNNKYAIALIDKTKGLPINEVIGTSRIGDDILFATRSGLTVINVADIKENQITPQCHIEKIRVNGMEKAFMGNVLNLKHNENLIGIDYMGISFLIKGKVPYRYRLLGADSTWVYTYNTNAIFSNVRSNRYTFEVQAQNNDGDWSPSQKLHINIRKPFWQTNFFIFLVAAVFSSILFAIYQMRIRVIHRRNELLVTTNLYKHQALRQQMNPHFIFNTLNSIQLFILENDTINSYKYLTKFARLIRITLDNSQETKIPVNDEIEALKLYLELESLRLEKKFTYNINVPQNDILTCKIPTLLIQPLVENSIWHGIMLKDSRTGHVSISFEKSPGNIICRIEDDGIGRKAAQALKSASNKQHKSLGFRITAQRLELLNTIYKGQFGIEYTDLTHPDGSPRGTLVTVRIPI